MAGHRNTAWNVVVGGGHNQIGVSDSNQRNATSGSGGVHDGDPLQLHGSDHPGMMLVQNPLSGNNYLPWSRSMRIALGAKVKLGFINGQVEIPDAASSEFEQWKRVDCMVISWILNSISKDIVEAFLYADSAKDLWDELAERYGECNGPLLYQLQREISNITQGNASVATYYTKLKKLWDEYGSLTSQPICTCGASKSLTEKETNEKLIQFLMGLNDGYDHVRNQILLMDPLPSVNKAYSMVLRVEKQRNVHTIFPETMDNSAMFSKVTGYGRGGTSKGVLGASGSSGGRGKGGYRRTKEEKARLICEYCKESGHEVNDCFKLHGYPDWYKKMKEEKGRTVANMTTAVSKGTQFGDMSILIQQEIAKFMAGQMTPDFGKGETALNFVHLPEFAGPEE